MPSLAYFEIGWTTIRLHLTNTGCLKVTVRRLIMSCQISQASKHDGAKTASRRQVLYAGHPWQKVAANLVRSLPTMAKRKKWILVLTNDACQCKNFLILLEVTMSVVASVVGKLGKLLLDEFVRKIPHQPWNRVGNTTEGRAVSTTACEEVLHIATRRTE